MLPIIIIIVVIYLFSCLLHKISKLKSNAATQQKGIFGYRTTVPFDKQSINWCANFLDISSDELKEILIDIPQQYKRFRMRKRKGGYRTISAPSPKLLAIQQTIYLRILKPTNIHPAATGFRSGYSIVNNARTHLGNTQVLQTDIQDFFGSIKTHRVKSTFIKMGYPPQISTIFSRLCCLKGRLPQGAPTSPNISNIIAYNLDQELNSLSAQYGLSYSRYADDLTFSGNNIPLDTFLPTVRDIIQKHKFVLNAKKTKFSGENRRKIITGISISSGLKMTIPKAKKRQIRKDVHFILTKGLMAHQSHIGSKDPAYLQRLIGYLNFWHSVEPDNRYVTKSLDALKRR